MDQNREALTCHLFAIVTEIVEEMHECSVQGQSPRLAPSPKAAKARELIEYCQRVKSLAEAILTVIEDPIDEQSESRN